MYIGASRVSTGGGIKLTTQNNFKRTKKPGKIPGFLFCVKRISISATIG